MARLYVRRAAIGNTTFLAWTWRAGARSVAAMTSGAQTPEELDTLLEDAFVLRDGAMLGQLFDDGAVFANARGGPVARGGAAIGRALGELWATGGTYVAGPRHVLQAGGTALVVGDGAIHVARRDSDGVWRAVIAVLHTEHPDSNPNGGAMNDQMTTLEPVATHGGEGEARWWLGSLAEIKLTGAQTGGALSIVEVTESAGAQAPLHVHHREDEGFWILDGDVRIEVGTRRSTRAPATSPSPRAASHTAIPSAPAAAACCSS